MNVMRTLRRLQPETAQAVVFFILRMGLVPPVRSPEWPRLRNSVWGLAFSNPIGLAAGVDKSAEVFDKLFDLRPGFIEVGTVTPRPQLGNPKPRIFRLEEDQAIINRLGFNNDGVEEVRRRLSARNSRKGVVGANIGINSDTTDYLSDYMLLLRRLYDCVDYFTVNVSSPNTPGLRDLQSPEKLHDLLCRLISERNVIGTDRSLKPILVKISPDLSPSEEKSIAEVVSDVPIDGVIISNTTVERPSNLSAPRCNEAGGLSGAPLFARSTELLRSMYSLTNGQLPLVGVGGIFTGADAYEKIRSGASLIQLYTALVYRGRKTIYNICNELNILLERDGFNHVSEAIGADVSKRPREPVRAARRLA